MAERTKFSMYLVYSAVIIGLICGVVLVFAIEFVDRKLHIDDPVGASSVHGVCGILGTLLTGLLATDGSVFYGGGWHFFAYSAWVFWSSTFGRLRPVSCSFSASRSSMVCESANG